ncbi:MAG: zinc-binding dehydrogenase, partial [Rickettsiales bacterium]|nr:zinc-binding dehydrogenase [Rickettsiales bacterium]
LPLPKGIDLKTAASLPEAAATSMMALVHEGCLKAGERVLIHGGTSGVGLLMTQIAKSLGAEMFTTVGGAQKAEFVRNLGITPIDHHAAPFDEQLMALTHNEGVDVIIDTLGGPELGNHLRLLRRNGRIVSLAMLEGAEIPAATKMARLVMNHLTWRGATLRSRSLQEKAALMDLVLTHVWPALEHGGITPHIDSCFALNEAKKALNRMQERLHMGKILLEVLPREGAAN